jgi:hypothetical protein
MILSLYFDSFVDIDIFSSFFFLLSFLDLHVSSFFLGPSCIHIFFSIAMPLL